MWHKSYTDIKRIDWELSKSSQERFKVIVSKSNMEHFHSKINICTEFEGPRSILCLVIIWTRFGLYIIQLKATVTLTFERLFSNSLEIIHIQRQMCVLNLMNLRSTLCSVTIQTRFGLQINMLKVTVTLTFDLKINRDHLHSETHVCAKFD